MQKLDIKSVRRRTWWSVYQDGFLEIGLGIIFLLAAITFAIGRVAVIYGALLFVIITLVIMPDLRRRFTYPRIGYAELRYRDFAKYYAVLITFIDIVLFAVILSYFDMSDDARQRVVVVCANPSVIVGLITAAVFVVLRILFGMRSYQNIALISLLLGFGTSLASISSWKTDLVLYFALMGSGLLVWGCTMFSRFVADNPLHEEEGSGDE
jgi:hypothetical protein